MAPQIDCDGANAAEALDERKPVEVVQRGGMKEDDGKTGAGFNEVLTGAV